MSDEDRGLITLLVMEGYKGLAGAIVLQACADYDTAIQKRDKALQEEVESFFRGSWYRILCDIPGETVMAKIRESGMAPFRITQKEAKTDETKRINRRRRERRHTDAVHDEYWNTFLAPGAERKNRKARKVVCLDTGDIFDTTRAAAKHFFVSQPAVVAVCRRRAKQTGGHRFAYYIETK